MADIRDGVHESAPVLTGARRRRRVCKRGDRIGRLDHMIKHALRGSWTDAGNQMHQPEARNAVARIFDETQQCQHVLDVSSVEKFEPAEFYERNVAASELDF